MFRPHSPALVYNPVQPVRFANKFYGATMKQLIVMLTITSLALASGCTTFDPYTGEEKTSNTAKGAGIGAGVGAVLAYIANRDESSKKRKNCPLVEL